jgi:hypothetical protein
MTEKGDVDHEPAEKNAVEGMENGENNGSQEA